MEEVTENLQQNDNKMSSNLENELKEHLSRVEGGIDEQIKKDNPNIDDVKPFIVPDFVLDFLQDKPIEIQKIIICKNLSTDQKKKVEHVFLPNANELKINREAIKELLSDLCSKYPELQPYFSNKVIFLGTFAFGYYERKTMVESELVG